MKKEYSFQFGRFPTRVIIQHELPPLEQIRENLTALGYRFSGYLLVCDEHTEVFARRIAGDAVCVLKSGEEEKTWPSIERILKLAKDRGLGRDGLFIGVGGGVVSDLSAFAASIYMRGARLCVVSTTLLGMADAAVGGKTGFDLFGIKNFAGTFFPARLVYMPLESLNTLPEYEWKSGMAEIIKTAVLDREEKPESPAYTGSFFSACLKLREGSPPGVFPNRLYALNPEGLFECITRSVEFKGRIVEADPEETGGKRALLNLGHTFAHALEASLGLGSVSHGEAVAWGLARSCELGFSIGITSEKQIGEIKEVLALYGYEIRTPHPLLKDIPSFMQALGGDKKKSSGQLSFIVPCETGAVIAKLGAGLPPDYLHIVEKIIENL
ncbi:MAG: 3-dehydroquinate synthase [Treponema sp.]|jgi:3-dehydroquinate synthase|nr:3-dehydroquinate synthase [Treponema sp.]